jgi:hypothetical protein
MNVVFPCYIHRQSFRPSQPGPCEERGAEPDGQWCPVWTLTTWYTIGQLKSCCLSLVLPYDVFR